MYTIERTRILHTASMTPTLLASMWKQNATSGST